MAEIFNRLTLLRAKFNGVIKSDGNLQHSGKWNFSVTFGNNERLFQRYLDKDCAHFYHFSWYPYISNTHTHTKKGQYISNFVKKVSIICKFMNKILNSKETPVFHEQKLFVVCTTNSESLSYLFWIILNNMIKYNSIELSFSIAWYNFLKWLLRIQI